MAVAPDGREIFYTGIPKVTSLTKWKRKGKRYIRKIDGYTFHILDVELLESE